MSAHRYRLRGEEGARPAPAETLLDRLRADLLGGKAVRVIDCPRDARPDVIAALAVLRDELPIRMGWQTISESHLAETRMRCKSYRIDAEHLRVLREERQWS